MTLRVADIALCGISSGLFVGLVGCLLSLQSPKCAYPAQDRQSHVQDQQQRTQGVRGEQTKQVPAEMSRQLFQRLCWQRLLQRS